MLSVVPDLLSTRRPLGRTGFMASRIGAGDLADRSLPLERCAATLRRALEHGLNVVDTAPGYEGGFSEEIVGEALRGFAGQVFVIDKIDVLDAPVAPQVTESLCRLRRPSCDLFVFHDVSTTNKWQRLVTRGGGFEELEACRRAGQLRFRGISSHHPDVLAAAIPSGLCDVVMFPVGPFVDARYLRESLPLARRHGVGVVSFKTFGAGKLVADTSGYGKPLEGAVGLPRLTVQECLDYTLSCDPDVALVGLSTSEEQDQMFEAARNFTLQDPAAMRTIEQRAAAAVAGKGPCWWNPG
jgi:1-deoxyxylulose-5-phosphate synthase